jgi:hypothetical protein
MPVIAVEVVGHAWELYLAYEHGFTSPELKEMVGGLILQSVFELITI